MKPVPFNALAKLLSLHHKDQRLITGIAIDSRKIECGDLFFALPGNKVNGHSFLQEASLKGAVGAIIHEDYRGENFGLSLLRVPDVLTTLQELAKKYLSHSRAKIIAITGSLGKTTTKEFSASLLSTYYRIFASPLSYNSQATVPLSILMSDGTEDYLILEMGMTHAGNIQSLITIAPPNISLITTLATQHAVNFSDGLSGISREKAVIFSNPKTELGIVHHDIPFLERVIQTGTCAKKSFSTGSPEADYFLEWSSQGICIHTKGEPSYELELDLPVKVHYQNFLAGVALARSLSVPWSMIKERSPFLKLPPMRFEKIEKQGIVFINDAFNANPDSMKAALENLPSPPCGGKIIAVLGDMDALGVYSEQGHISVAQTALLYVDYLLCLGPRCTLMHQIWKQAKKPVEIFENREVLENYLKKIAQPGDVILLKGARAHALDKILESF